MRYSQFVVIASILVIFVGCGSPKIDTTTDESTKTSIQKVRDSLTQDKQKEFDDAIKIIAFSKVDFREILAKGANAASNIQGDIKSTLNGKTAEQVLEVANKIRAERAERERKQALEEINELEVKQLKAQQSTEELKKIEVVRSRFSLEPQKYGRPQPIIELTVKNNTDKAISRIYFQGTITSQGRAVPWFKDKFNYSISGGLEPNETASWRLAPNMFSDWGKVNAPDDAIFTVIVEQMDGADGKTLYSVIDFSEKDKTRLDELKKKYASQ